MNNNDVFVHTDKQKKTIKELLDKGRRNVPTFLDEGACEILYVPIDDGELRVFHHKPQKQTTKRPIVFIPGYVAAPSTWTDFHIPHQGFGEYYYLETREKRSSKIKRTRETSMTISQTAYDLGVALENLGLKKKDYVLASSSYGGAVILDGLINKYFDPPTTFVHDPIVKWIWEKSINNILLRIFPMSLLNTIRIPIAYIFTAGMKNKDNRRRMIEFARGLEPWKFKKCTLQNNKFNIFDDLKKIENEVFINTGPLDRYHPRLSYYNYAKEIPKGRFLFMNTADKNRQLLAGVIGTEFAKVNKEEGLPEILKQFEIEIKR
jgi:pimeloyl-ACP methyl ester carboxylesterase